MTIEDGPDVGSNGAHAVASLVHASRRAQESPRAAKFLESVTAGGREVVGIHRAVAGAADNADAVFRVGWGLQTSPDLGRRELELVIFSVAHQRGAQFIWARHEQLAVPEWLTPDETSAIRSGTYRESMDGKSTSTCDFALAVSHAEGVEEAAARLARHMAPAELLTATLAALYYCMMCDLDNYLGVGIDEREP